MGVSTDNKSNYLKFYKHKKRCTVFSLPADKKNKNSDVVQIKHKKYVLHISLSSYLSRHIADDNITKAASINSIRKRVELCPF